MPKNALKQKKRGICGRDLHFSWVQIPATPPLTSVVFDGTFGGFSIAHKIGDWFNFAVSRQHHN